MTGNVRPTSLKARLETGLVAIWYQDKKTTFTTALALNAMEAIHKFYRSLRKSQITSFKSAYSGKAPLVLVIGNLIAGGAGKTPIVKAVCRLMSEKGYRIGVISRGYGRDAGSIQVIKPGETPEAEAVGDEPLWLSKETGCPVAVGRQRAEALQALLQTYPDLDMVVSDDGLQHQALNRHVEWVVFDDRAAGNGRLLPAGPLREPLHRLDSVEAVFCSGLSVQTLGQKLNCQPNLYWYEARNELAGFTNHCTGQKLTLAHALSLFGGQTIEAFTGLGHPEKFFRALRLLGLTPTETYSLPDHYVYPAHFLENLRGQVLLTTGKDAVKLQNNDDRLWVADIETTLPNQPIEQLEALLGFSTHQHHGLSDLQGQFGQAS